jgi:hypothetical protein
MMHHWGRIPRGRLPGGGIPDLTVCQGGRASAEAWPGGSEAKPRVTPVG